MHTSAKKFEYVVTPYFMYLGTYIYRNIYLLSTNISIIPT